MLNESKIKFFLKNHR